MQKAFNDARRANFHISTSVLSPCITGLLFQTLWALFKIWNTFTRIKLFKNSNLKMWNTCIPFDLHSLATFLRASTLSSSHNTRHKHVFTSPQCLQSFTHAFYRTIMETVNPRHTALPRHREQPNIFPLLHCWKVFTDFVCHPQMHK